MTMLRLVPSASGPGSGRPSPAAMRATGIVAGPVRGARGARASPSAAEPSRSRDRLAASAETRRRLERVVVMLRLKPYPIASSASGGSPHRPAACSRRAGRSGHGPVACLAAVTRPIALALPHRGRPPRTLGTAMALLGALSIATAACAPSAPGNSQPPATSAASAPATSPPASPESATPQATPGDPTHLRLAPFAIGLNRPVNVANADDGSGRLFVNEQDGVIRVIGAGGTVRTEQFLDIRRLVLSGGEQGLLGLAFHPGFPGQPRVFVDYTRVPDGATVIAEY